MLWTRRNWILAAASAAGGAWAQDWGALVEWMNEDSPDWMKDMVQDAAREQVKYTLRQHAPELLRMADEALKSADAEELAFAQPYIRKAFEFAKEIPELAPYVDWLTARMPYFDAARRAASLVAEPTQRPTPKPKPGAPPAPRPAPKPAKDAPTRNRRREVASSAAVWRAMVADKAPATQEGLVKLVKEEFRAAGMPQAWAWIAEVESTFRPTARSPAGAVGLFQLMPATAESLGLKLRPEDQRKDPQLNARAAAKYLRQIYGRFRDWPLTLAAYNAGPARVAAKLKNQREKTFERIASSLSMETQMYVPRILETVRKREGLDGRKLPGPKGV